MSLPDNTTQTATAYKANIDESISNLSAPVDTGGTGDAYTATMGITAYETRRLYVVKFNRSNTTTAPTLNIDSLGAKTIKTPLSGALGIGQLWAGKIALLFYNGASMLLFGFVDNGIVTDNAGNLGIGVVPESALNLGYKHLRLGQAVGLMAIETGQDLWITDNARYEGGGWKYINAQVAAGIHLNPTGDIQFNTATKGILAGDPLTWESVGFIYNDGGYTVGYPTGASKGIGTLNVQNGIYSNGAQAHALIDVQTFTTSGTWTKPTGTNSVEVICIGGGGGGGGATTTGGQSGACGGGGGSGQYSYSFITTGIGATETVTVGTGGAGHASMAGSTGTNSSFGSLVVALGGPFGNGTAGSSSYMTAASSTTPATGTQVGDIKIPVKPGETADYPNQEGTTASGSVGVGANGADGPLGYGAGGAGSWAKSLSSGSAVGLTGSAATGYGAGGSGAVALNSATGRAGGAGSGGIVIVKSYS